MRKLSSRGRLFALFAVVLVLLAFLPAASAEGQTCNTYNNTGVRQVEGYGTVCGGSSLFSCTECYRWTNYTTVESCVTVGNRNCFQPLTRQE